MKTKGFFSKSIAVGLVLMLFGLFFALTPATAIASSSPPNPCITGIQKYHMEIDFYTNPNLGFNVGPTGVTYTVYVRYVLVGGDGVYLEPWEVIHTVAIPTPNDAKQRVRKAIPTTKEACVGQVRIAATWKNTKKNVMIIVGDDKATRQATVENTWGYCENKLNGYSVFKGPLNNTIECTESIHPAK